MVYRQPQRTASETNINHLRIVRHQEEAAQLRYYHFGAFLQSIRNRIGYSQNKMVATLALSFQNENVQELGSKAYGNLERDDRFPQYNELWPLFQGLVAVCDDCDVQFSITDANDFYDLARSKVNSSKKWARSEADWRHLRNHINDFINERYTNHYADPSKETTKQEEAIQHAQEEKAKLLSQLKIDTSHILGRDQWLKHILSCLEPKTTVRKKVIVIQAVMGTGKTSCLKLIQKRLLEDAQSAHVIFHECKTSVDALELSSREKTPVEHLEALLAHVVNDLQPQQAERREAPSTKEQIRLTLQAVSDCTKSLVILVDDTQVLLESDGELSSPFQQFLDGLIEHNHQASLFLATRAWPGWAERKDPYLLQTGLETLSPEICIELWKQLGYINEQERILQQAAELCEYNPRMMEIVARHLDKPIHPFGWSSWQETMDANTEQGLARFVKNPHTLSQSMVDAFPLIDEIVTTRLSLDARQLLTTLALSPLPLPAPLLMFLCQHPQRSIKELVRVSLLARDSTRLRLLPLVTESILQQLSREERTGIEQQLIVAYERWVREGNYRDEQEQAIVIAELTILHLKHQRFLEAAELIIRYGWLLFAAGHARRIARDVDSSIRSLHQGFSAENEAGSLLLRLRFKRFFKDWKGSRCEQAYLELYKIMSQGRIQFKPRITLYIIHHYLQYLMKQERYSEAYVLIKNECNLHKELQINDPTTYVELLDRQAQVAGRWGDSLAEVKQEKAFELRREAINIHQQCVDQLHRYEDFASPLLRSHILYQRARILHDLSFYERVTGDNKAMLHIEESLSIKKAGYSTPGSLAITYDDYAHLLAKQGKYQQALYYSDFALQLTQPMVEAKLSDAASQKGMLLVNRGKLLLQLKRFEEAQIHFAVGKSLVEGTSRQDLSFPAAEAGLCSIEEQRRVNPKGYFDHRWFPRYREFSSYSDVKWLTCAGPFTLEEQREWDTLNEKKEETSKNRLSEIIAQSQERELAASFAEQREPHFHYPLIPLDDVAKKVVGLSSLRTEIQREETNVVVRQFYLDAIDERINELEMIAAAGKQNDEAFWIYTQRLYALPITYEMILAIRPLAQLLSKGLQNSSTADLAARIIQQTQNWSIDPMSLTEVEQKSEQSTQEQTLPVAKTLRYFSPETVQRFFEDIFRRYQFPWTIVRDPSTDHPRVSLTDKQLILPANSQISSSNIREILAHEVEMHVFRSVAGEKSRLLLLSLGLANFLETEEGLATYSSVKATHLGAPKPEKTWTGTLATGLAAGVICGPYSFHALRSFLMDIFMLRGLLRGKKTREEIQLIALKDAHKRCLRTWRGVSNLSSPGVCATKDSVYLRGYLAVCQRLQQEPTTFDRLLVGSVGLEHLDNLEQLDITEPHVHHQRLAYDTELEAYITQFVNENTTE